MIEIGGEVRVKGNSDKKRPWRIGIDRPEEEVTGVRNLEMITGFWAVMPDMIIILTTKMHSLSAVKEKDTSQYTHCHLHRRLIVLLFQQICCPMEIRRFWREVW